MSFPRPDSLLHSSALFLSWADALAHSRSRALAHASLLSHPPLPPPHAQVDRIISSDVADLVAKYMSADEDKNKKDEASAKAASEDKAPASK